MGGSSSSLSLSSPVLRHCYSEYDRIHNINGNSNSTTNSNQSTNQIPTPFPSRPPASSSSSTSLPFVYSLLLRFRPFPGLPIDFSHLAVLYCLDQSHSGRPTLNDLIEFLAFCESKQREFGRSEFQSRLEGLCMMKFVFDSGLHGSEFLADWICKLVIANKPCVAVDSAPGLVYVHRDSIFPLYSSLKPYFPLEVEFTEFFDSLQLRAENLGLLELEEESLDNYIPIPVLRAFSFTVIKGILSIAKSIGLPSGSGVGSSTAAELGAIEQLNATAVKKRRMSKKWPIPLLSNRSLVPGSLRPPIGKSPSPMGRARSVSGLGENSFNIHSTRINATTAEKSNLKSLRVGRSFHGQQNEENNSNFAILSENSAKLGGNSTTGSNAASSNSNSTSFALPGSISPLKNSRLQLHSPLNSPSAKRRSPHHGKTQLEIPSNSTKEEINGNSNGITQEKRSQNNSPMNHPSGIPKIPKNKVAPMPIY